MKEGVRRVLGVLRGREEGKEKSRVRKEDDLDVEEVTPD